MNGYKIVLWFAILCIPASIIASMWNPVIALYLMAFPAGFGMRAAWTFTEYIDSV